MTDMNGQPRLLILRQLRLRQPRRRTFDAHRFTGQQIGNETLAQLQIAQGITAGWVEQAGAETQFTAGGDRRRHVQRRGNFPRHHVHPTQATEQRHHRAAVFGNGQHRRLGAFFQQQWRQRADHDPGRAQGNDRRVLLIELAQGRAELVIDAVRAFNPLGQAMDQGARVQLLNLARGGEAAIAENDNRRNWTSHQPCHLSPGTMISEKYGEDIGST